jgi:hypothetical protein
MAGSRARSKSRRRQPSFSVFRDLGTRSGGRWRPSSSSATVGKP